MSVLQVKLLNWAKEEKVKEVFDDFGWKHEQVFEIPCEDIFNVLCVELFDRGLNVRVLHKADNQVLLHVDVKSFGVQRSKKKKKEGHTKGSHQNEHKPNESYTVDEVLPHIKERKFKDSKGSRKRDFDGDMINIASLRLLTFQEKGCTCVRCGIEGTVFLKDRNDPSYPWHFNLYGKNADGDLVLMTKDHILPKSKGGRDHIDNMQTMCTICNSAKGNTLEEWTITQNLKV